LHVKSIFRILKYGWERFPPIKAIINTFAAIFLNLLLYNGTKQQRFTLWF
jgi:hypothetical protein